MTQAFNIDCMEYMRSCSDNQFDIAIVDPPYFSGPEKRKYYGKSASNNGVKRVDYPVTDTWGIPEQEYFDELLRVSKHQIVWGINYFDTHLGSGVIVWDKCNGDSSFSDAELAYCSLHDSVRMFRFMWNGMLQGKSISEGHIQQGNKRLNEARIHPTQKPILLYRWLYSQYVKEGQSVLDTHLGSGSSRIAAHLMGIDFVGTELSPIHFANQEERFKQYERQLNLFHP